MIEQNNQDHPSPKRSRRGRISPESAGQIKTAYASGIGLREIARNMGIAEGTILARSKREGWTREIQNAKALTKRENALLATSVEAAAITMQQRGERHLGRMANIVEKTLPHVEGMEPGAVLERIDDVETLDKVGRRTFGISDAKDDSTHWAVNIAILGT